LSHTLVARNAPPMRSTTRPAWSGRGNSVRYQTDWRPSRAASWRGTSMGFHPLPRPLGSRSASPSPSGIQIASQPVSSRRPGARCARGMKSESPISPVRPLRGRAEQHLPADGRLECSGLLAFDESEDAAAESRAHDARAIAAVERPRSLEEDVEVGGRDLELVAK